MNIEIDELHKIVKTSTDIAVSYLNEIPYVKGEPNKVQEIDNITYKEDVIEECDNKIFTEEIMSILSEEEKEVIRLRYFYDMIRLQIANILGISQVQVSRIEKRALMKIWMTPPISPDNAITGITGQPEMKSAVVKILSKGFARAESPKTAGIEIRRKYRKE
jgi:DNA-directed RNA polymerase sigma subunit (sigma70/sigma32)